MKNLIKTIQNTAFQRQLWQTGDKIVLGISGGPDSVCLLDVLSKIAPKAGLQLIIAHVNHGLRGKDSDKDEKFVRKLAEKYGVKIAVFNLIRPAGTFSLTKEKGTRKFSSENKLREIRYTFFEKVRKENKFDSIAVAHNADDQVETYLMRVIRGAGLQGLSAMKYKNEKIIRPLLNISRKEILEYLNRTDKVYRTDRTNLQDLFLRNKIRGKLILFLEKNFNPKIKETIFDATQSIAEDLDFIESLSENIRKASQPKKARPWSAKKILALHPAMQRRIILKMISAHKADLKNIESAHIEEILKTLKSTKSKRQVVIFKDLKFVRKGDKVVIVKN